MDFARALLMSPADSISKEITLARRQASSAHNLQLINDFSLAPLFFLLFLKSVQISAHVICTALCNGFLLLCNRCTTDLISDFTFEQDIGTRDAKVLGCFASENLHQADAFKVVEAVEYRAT